ncbi:hypothetical protein BN2537_417 [Streptomyces venezuelae]|nr:hypothetical protein BN2537_417 [Streptomyces venezuelae]
MRQGGRGRHSGSGDEQIGDTGYRQRAGQGARKQGPHRRAFGVVGVGVGIAPAPPGTGAGGAGRRGDRRHESAPSRSPIEFTQW